VGQEASVSLCMLDQLEKKNSLVTKHAFGNTTPCPTDQIIDHGASKKSIDTEVESVHDSND
jgi:hypothetical protein